MNIDDQKICIVHVHTSIGTYQLDTHTSMFRGKKHTERYIKHRLFWHKILLNP